MKAIYITSLILWFLILVSCTKDTLEDKKDTEISSGAVQQLKKQLLDVNESDSVNNNEARIVSIQAKRFEYDKKEIRVKQWERLIIQVENTDTIHGIGIPSMQLVWDDQIEVDTSVAWEFEFICANYCWDKHREMKWKIIIE